MSSYALRTACVNGELLESTISDLFLHICMMPSAVVCLSGLKSRCQTLGLQTTRPMAFIFDLAVCFARLFMLATRGVSE